MANHPSADKRNRQRIKRTTRNRALRSSLRTALKQARTALDGGDQAAAKPIVEAAKVALAKAASKNIVHWRAASRKTSRLMLQLNKIAGS